MPAPVRLEPLVREGRDAVVAAFRRQEELPPACPYNPGTKRARFWTHGAERARAAIALLMKIGA